MATRAFATRYIPLAFILSIYLGTVYTRWWAQYMAVPWAGKIGMLLRDFDNKDDDEGLQSRVTFIRWLLLGLAITFQYVSRVFRKRHPDIQSLADAGLATASEVAILERSEYQTEICFLWCTELVRKHERDYPERVAKDLRSLRYLLIDWRSGCATLRGFEYQVIPVALSQCMGFAVYVYVLQAL